MDETDHRGVQRLPRKAKLGKKCAVRRPRPAIDRVAQKAVTDR
jgi:hypothetical protein